MNAKKLALATIAGGVAMWLLAGFWHLVLMTSFYTAAGMGEHENMHYIDLGYLILAVLMAYLYPVGYKGGSPILEGLRFGIAMGLLWVLPHGIVMLHGASPTSSLTVVLINSAWHAIEQGVGGIVIGYVYGRHTAAEETDAS